MSTTDSRLPREHEAERYLIACLVDYPERAHEVLPLCKPTDFVDELHQRIWKRFTTQFACRGEIDRLAAGKELNCCDYLIELDNHDVAATTVHALSRAEMVKLAARSRQLHEIFTKAADAILRGRPGDAVLAQVQLALEPFAEEVIG